MQILPLSELTEYRKGVCVVIQRPRDCQVLVFHRIDAANVDDGWQFPQGGIDLESDLVLEAKRELLEEIGTDEIIVKKITHDWFYYDYPEGPHQKHGKLYRGQCHRWVLAELNGPDSQLRFNNHHHPEFNDYCWILPADAIARIVDFKRDAYSMALSNLGLI